MTETEYDIIDQLYFVTSYEDLLSETGMTNETIKNPLWSMVQKDWIKCLSNPETEVFPNLDEFDSNYSNYHYLATKKGLFKHNTT